MEYIPIDQIKPNPSNPRVIIGPKFEKLVASIREFPRMLELRPLVIDENNVILGGNMRYQALQQLGKKRVPCVRAADLTEEQKREFIIKDNVGFGQWDYELLANNWDVDLLEHWGLDLWNPADDPDLVSEEGEKPEPTESAANKLDAAIKLLRDVADLMPLKDCPEEWRETMKQVYNFLNMNEK